MAGKARNVEPIVPTDEDETRFRRDRSRTIWGHSLPAAAVCLGAGATIVLVAIFGQPG
jgi:hypothetical protein